MMETTQRLNDRVYIPLIWAFSIIVPIVVGVLLTPGLLPPLQLGFSPYLLPKLNAIINSAVSIFLVMGIVFIKQKKITAHRSMMVSAFVFSAVFLVSYVLYHLSVGHTAYCEAGLVSNTLYYIVLISHVVLSVTIIPLASFSIYRAVNGRFEKHKKLARITFPLWLYVSVTGVIVYLFIAPCHPA